MSRAQQILALVRSHGNADEPQFYTVAMQIAANEARRGNGRFAQELKARIDERKARAGVIG